MITREDRDRRRVRIAVFGVSLIGFFMLLGYLLFLSPLFAISQIVCAENGNPCSPDILAELDRYRGTQTLFFKPGVVSSRLEKANPLVGKANVTIQFPHKLSVELSERVAKFQLARISQRSSVWTIDRDGIVIEAGEQREGLPIVFFSGEETLVVGNKVPEEQKKAIELLADLGDQAGDDPPPLIGAAELTISLRDGTAVRFSLHEPLPPQLAALQLLINQARIDGSRYREIDLRFSQPIVK